MDAAQFDLDARQRELLDRARAAGRALDPIARAGEPRRVNRPLVRALAEHGLLARLFGRDDAGGRIRALDLCLLREGLACECTEAETALALQGLGAFPIADAGGADVAHWVDAAARGDAVAAFALSEPDAGSDAGALSLRAERDGDGYRLSGTKTWISNAPDADVYTVFARSEDDPGARGVTAFVVAGDAAGVTGERLELVAEHPVGRLELDGVRVPAGHVLGRPGEGFAVAMRTLDLFRPSVGAFAVGMAQTALEAATGHAASRRAFGRPLREFQAVSHRLADMATRTRAARLLVYSAAAAYDSGARVTKEAAMAKLYATEAAQEVIDAAIQIHGARGLERGHVLEHLYRDVRATRIYEGTSEIQREIVARELYRDA
ncbi:MAG TPA: acyl-CoA dehydrogenase family protein [Actinomycetota bacterium]|nr:acyl-CoA dehydrogenase family protein [Actinomycetota bacterium]